MWKFHDFYITHILREINLGDFKSAKSAILTHLEPLNFDFHECLHIMKVAIYQLNKIHSPKMAVLELLDSPNMISRKILNTVGHLPKIMAG